MSNEQAPNPFAPTPLGKGWTPPGAAERAAERPVDESPGDSQAAVPLDDLFDAADAPHSADSARHDEQAGADETDQGLDDLFAPVEPAPGSPRADGPESGPGLDDLFAPAEKVPDEPARTAPATKPRVRRRGVPDALRPRNKPANPDDARGDTDRREMPPLPEKRYDGNPATRTDATADTRPAGPKNVPVAAAGPAPAKRRSLFEYGAEEIARAWTIVDQTLAIVASDISLQHATSGIALTADPVAYAAQRVELHAALRRKMASAGIAPSGLIDSETILDLIVDEMSGISVLGELFRDPSVDEILVDRWDIVSVERHGNLERTHITFRDPQHAESCARVLALKISDRAVSRAIPLVTAELPSARVTFAFGAVVKGGLSITIRKFRPLLGLTDLLEYGSLTPDMVAFLRDAVRARAGILVSGGTGTGKTTIVNLLSSFIPDNERVVSIEDAFELKLANTHVVSLQTKEASSLDDTVSVTLAELLRNTLRMRPDRIIVGEIREGAGAMVMLSAASTGHDGTLTTVHANSAEAAVNERLPDLVRQSRGGLETETILRSVANAFDLVIQVGRTRDGRRYLSQIAALDGIEDGRIRLQPVFTGSETSEGIRFERHDLGADTELARRLVARRAGGEEI